MIEFEVIKDTVHYLPPPANLMKQYENALDEFDRVGGVLYTHIQMPQPTAVHTSVTVLMAEMVEEGWNVHTFSVDSNGVYFALMEREVNG